MLIYQIYKLYYLLLIKSNETIPNLTFELPNYHGKFTNIINGIGYFLPLSDLSNLLTILITYQLIRLAIAFSRAFRR